MCVQEKVMYSHFGMLLQGVLKSGNAKGKIVMQVSVYV